MARKVTKRQALTTFSIRSSSSALNFALVGSPPGEMASGGAPLPNAPRSPPLMSPPPRAREEARRGGEHRWRDRRSRLWILRCRESSEPPLEVIGARICGVALRLLRLDGVAPARCRRLARICGVAKRGPRLPRLACRRGPRPPRPQVASVVGLDAARRRAGERRRPAARQPRDEWRSLPLPQGAEAAAGNRSRRAARGSAAGSPSYHGSWWCERRGGDRAGVGKRGDGWWRQRCRTRESSRDCATRREQLHFAATVAASAGGQTVAF
jgi:hypothetical protein